jgi:hypothetical protein
MPGNFYLQMKQFACSCASLPEYVTSITALSANSCYVYIVSQSILHFTCVYVSFIRAMSVYRKEQKLWCCTKSSLLAGPFCYSGGFSIALHIHTLVPVDITPGLLEASNGTCSRGINGTTNKQISTSSGSISLFLRRDSQTAKSRRACLQVQRLFVIYLY